MTASSGRVARNVRTARDALPSAEKLPMKAETPVFTGWLMAKNPAGLGVPFTETTGLISAGRASRDAPAHSVDGARDVLVDTMVEDIEQSAIPGDFFVDADAPAVAYGVDNATIGKLATGRSIAGVFFGINPNTGKARLWSGVAAFAMALGLLAGGHGESSVRTLRARAASTANLSATLSGITVTADANGALGAVDGVTLVVGDKLFVKDQAAAAANGLFVVTSLGSGSAKYVLKRAPEFDVSAEAGAGAAIYVAEGTINADTIWDLTTNDPIVLGTTALVFAKRPTLGEFASTANGKGASIVGLEDSAGNTSATNVETAIAELYGFNKKKIQTFEVTLDGGAVTKSTGIVVTSSSRVTGIVPTVRGGTFPAGGYQALAANNVVGGAGVGAVTITARKADGTLENGCTDTIAVILID